MARLTQSHHILDEALEKRYAVYVCCRNNKIVSSVVLAVFSIGRITDWKVETMLDSKRAEGLNVGA